MTVVNTLKNIVFWYDLQHASLSEGLKTPRDALRLYRYAHLKRNQHLPDMADTWPASERVNALGYDPMD